MIENRILKAVSLLLNDPSLFFKSLCCLMKVSIFPGRFRSPFDKKKDGVIFRFDFNYDPNIKYMYCGLYEYATVNVMQKIIKDGETFIDVGANIGYLTSIGAGMAGRLGQVHSFEPVPEYFEILKKIPKTNPDYKIIVNQMALGEENGIASIDVTSLHNIGWNTMVPGLMKREDRRGSFEVQVCRLDSYIEENGLANISLIKIDVEGFEFPVLKGLQNYFSTSENRPLLIVEIAPAAYDLLGLPLLQLKDYLGSYGYICLSLHPPHIELDILQLKSTTSVIFAVEGHLAALFNTNRFRSIAEIFKSR